MLHRAAVLRNVYTVRPSRNVERDPLRNTQPENNGALNATMTSIASVWYQDQWKA